MNTLDQTTMNFSPAAALALQCILALVIFGVSLELSFTDFRRLLDAPKPVIAALCSQLIALPLLTFALIWVMDPLPSLALGLMMTAACPGGNMSNVLTHWSGGRTAVSMSATTISSLISPITTPLTFQFLGSLHPSTQAAMRHISVPYAELVMTILVALALPLIAGMTLTQLQPQLAQRIRKPLRNFGVAVFVLFVILAAASNIGIFVKVMGALFVLVALHNVLALACGFSFGSLFRVEESERRAITFETGVHNTALGLTLIFTYYQGLGGMALVVGWWGIWQLLTGGLIARYWAKRIPNS
jgi:BASS family bile acid:Na+ symporter